jgi:hypothetical protein
MPLISQKVGASSPSLADSVTILDNYTPNFLLLTEIAFHLHSGALPYTLRNRGYKMHYHPANEPPHLDTLPEARLLLKLIHLGGRC